MSNNNLHDYLVKSKYRKMLETVLYHQYDPPTPPPPPPPLGAPLTQTTLLVGLAYRL